MNHYSSDSRLCKHPGILEDPGWDLTASDFATRLLRHVPAGGTDDGKGDELIPEGVILRYGLGAHQNLEAGIVGQVTELAGVGSHLQTQCCLTACSLGICQDLHT